MQKRFWILISALVILFFSCVSSGKGAPEGGDDIPFAPLKQALIQEEVAEVTPAAYLPDAAEQAFWSAVEAGSLEEAATLAVNLSETGELYSLYASVLYNMLENKEKYIIYNFKYYRNPTLDYDLPALLAPVLEYFPGEQVLSLAGILMWEVHNQTAARDYLERALAINPENPFALNYYGMLFYEEDPARFLELSLQALGLRADYSDAYNNAAIAYHALGEIEKALELQITGIEKCSVLHDNTFGNLLFLLGEQALMLKWRAGELSDGESVELDNERLDFLHNLCRETPVKYRGLLDQLLADSLYREVDYLLSKAAAEQLTIPLEYYRANVAFLTDDPEGFRTLAGQARASGTLNSHQLYELATDFLYLQEARTAIDYFLAAREIFDPTDLLQGMRIYANLGIAYLMLDEISEGVPYLETALVYNPYDVLTLLNLGKIYHEHDQPDLARTYLEQALQYTTEQQYVDYINAILTAEPQTATGAESD